MTARSGASKAKGSGSIDTTAQEPDGTICTSSVTFAVFRL
jgi:hypothetical protein